MFSGNTVVEICGHHLHTTPRRVSALHDVPAELDELVNDCLAKKPEDRPQSAEDFVERLAAVEVPAWTREMARAWWDEHGAAVSAS